MENPPFIISAEAINRIAEISALLERHNISVESENELMLRKANRIKTIHLSLAIEGNTLTEDEVEAIVNGKSVAASLRQIQEVKNAIAVYDLFQTTLRAVKVSKPRKEPKKELEEVLAPVRSNPYITYSQLMEALHIKESAIYERIKKLKEMNFLKRVGGRSSGQWVII